MEPPSVIIAFNCLVDICQSLQSHTVTAYTIDESASDDVPYTATCRLPVNKTVSTITDWRYYDP